MTPETQRFDNRPPGWAGMSAEERTETVLRYLADLIAEAERVPIRDRNTAYELKTRDGFLLSAAYHHIDMSRRPAIDEEIADV